MWSSKMAARWRGRDGLLNGSVGGRVAGNKPRELIQKSGDVADMERNTKSCMDHCILAIFEDSAVASESKKGVDEDNEKLLSALTEMLDSVEDDDDDTLSPFDTLPESKLLIHPDCRDNSAIVPLTDRHAPRPKSPSVTFSGKSGGGNESNIGTSSLPQQFKLLSHAEHKMAENAVDVFTSTNLVNLVKLMHPYCLKLHVDEGDKLKRDYTLFSEGEVWRYEKPTEESDEEINVVSDDEAPQNKTKEKEQGNRDDGKLLKGVLVNGNSSRAPSSREKKRVSFGPVQVASFDESVEKELNEKTLTSGHTCETVSRPLNRSKAAEPHIPSSEMTGDKAEVVSLKGQTKAKSLSLQQYRQLRQKRQPLVEKQGNNTTKWPSASISEPPSELPPIPSLQGKRQNSSGPKTADYYPEGPVITTDHLHKTDYKNVSHHTSPLPRTKPSVSKPSTHLHRSSLKHPRSESRIVSPASPLPDTTGNVKVIVPQTKKSLVRKATLLNSDPPNPVLLPLPVSQQLTTLVTDHSSSQPKVDQDSKLQSIRHLQENQREYSTGSCQGRAPSSEPKPEVLLENQGNTTQLQEIKNKFTEISSDVSSASPTQLSESTSDCKKLQLATQKCSLSPTQETKQKPKTPQPLSPHPETQVKCKVSSTPFSAQPPCIGACIPAREVLPEVLPGIFPHEEPPPTPQHGCTVQNASGESGIEAPDLTSLLEQFEETQAIEERMCENKPEPRLVSVDLDHQRPAPVGSENISGAALEHFSTSETLRKLPDLQTLEHVYIPEALSTEIILSSQQEQPARRKNPPSKAIQIIEPRPLPSRKIHPSPPDSPTKYTSSHLQLSVSSDHDYCGPVNCSLTSATQRSRAKPSSLKDTPESVSELQVSSYNSSAAAKCRTQTSSGQAKSLSAQPKASSETELSPDNALQFLDCATGDCGANEYQTGPCTLPTPPPSPQSRGREKRRYKRRSPRSDSSCSSSSSSSSSCSSASGSPKRQKLRHKRSESSSCSSSCSCSVSHSPPRRNRLSYSRSRPSRSRSRSWSPSRSPSPQICHRRWRDVYSRESRRLRREHEIRIQKLKAIDERRVVYVGRIRRSMTHSELRERFSQFGEVECVSLHFRDRGDHYAFVTFYNMENAFAAIDNGSKLRKPDELPFDICFGGRRQFCNSNYSDLDANRDRDPSPAKSRDQDLDFDSLLKQAQRGIKR